MSGRRVDIAIVGGGLAGGLIALALHHRDPGMPVLLIEQDEVLGGNHRWSWFASDLDAEGAALLAQFRTTAWDGYEVRFPAYARRLRTRYSSLSSAEFDAGLRRELPESAILTGRAVDALDAEGVTLVDGERIAARAVIDCRGFVPSANLRGGWQVFMGRHLRTARPHGIARPVVMDATVEQLGGYRFVYVLPLGADELFVEDTYYRDTPELERRALSSRIDAFCRRHGLEGDILGGETGVLPVITGGDFADWQRETAVAGVARAGARGGFLHPLTSYTLPFAVETALAVAAEARLPGDQLAALLDARARRLWRRTRFYRRLGAMLFGAARPQERYRVFERFYRLPEGLIERFYAARSTLGDKARVLLGRPPVSVSRAIAALAREGAPLQGRRR